MTEIRREGDRFRIQAEGGVSFEGKQVMLCLGANVDVARTAGVTLRPGTEPHIKEVIAADPSGKSNVPGLWAAGTCAGTSVHTIITAGDGARVAINLISELKGERYVDHEAMKTPAETPAQA